MFGRDPRIPLSTLIKPRVRYMGNDENILSLEALKKIYYLVAQNLKIARERMTRDTRNFPQKFKLNDMVMIKNFDNNKKPMDPKYKGYYRIISFKGNQVELMSTEGGETFYRHITDVKYILPADKVIQQLPEPPKDKRSLHYNVNPNQVIDLQWKLATNTTMFKQDTVVTTMPTETTTNLVTTLKGGKMTQTKTVT